MKIRLLLLCGVISITSVSMLSARDPEISQAIQGLTNNWESRRDTLLQEIIGDWQNGQPANTPKTVNQLLEIISLETRLSGLSEVKLYTVGNHADNPSPEIIRRAMIRTFLTENKLIPTSTHFFRDKSFVVLTEAP